jgi:hypothetical protein
MVAAAALDAASNSKVGVLQQQQITPQCHEPFQD